jgi:hypothetical protein
VSQIVREVHGRHAARAELALDAIAISQRRRQPGKSALSQDGILKGGAANLPPFAALYQNGAPTGTLAAGTIA